MSSNSSIGNIMSRLSGLKSVSGRKVMPEADYLTDLESEQPDVSGSAGPLPNFSNFISPNANSPEPDRGGEITAQSYDVRANTVQNEKPYAALPILKGKVLPQFSNQFSQNPTPNSEIDVPQESGFWQSLGQNLASVFQSPQKETQDQPYAALPILKGKVLPQFSNRNITPENTPVENAQIGIQDENAQTGINSENAQTGMNEYKSPQVPEVSPGFFGAVKDYFSPTKNSQMDEYNAQVVQDAQLRAQGKDPAQVRAQVEADRKAAEQKALEHPWQYSAYGSASEVANNPALKSQFEEITGINYEPQVQAQVSAHEAAMKGVEDSLNGVQTQLGEREEGIKQRILNNQSTDADKYYIGLALLMPLLIGGFFGKEAALGALGGGAKGISDVLSGRQKEIRDDEASLLDINKQQSSNTERLANMALERAKLEPAIRKALPEQPEAHLMGMKEAKWVNPKTGKEERGVEVKPGLIAKPQFLNSKEGLADMRKAANELSAVKTFVKEVDDLTEDVAKIVTQLKDPSKAWKGLASFMKDKVPGSLSAMTEDVMFDGRMQNAGTLLEEKLGFLANAYGMAKDIGQLDRAAQNHIKKIIDNPTSTLLTPRDALNQVLEVRKLAQKGLVESAENQGFYPEFVIQDLEERNNDLFGGLNKKENEKRLAERKKQAQQGGTNYAK